MRANPLIRTAFSTVYLGIDGTGRVLLDNRALGQVSSHAVRGLIVATGAVEQVHPFEGWDLPGVMTVGGAQMLLKETGTPPPGPLLIAGSGPLLYAAAAQLARAGAKVLGVLERGRPIRAEALGMIAWPRQAVEALVYLLWALPLGLRFGASVRSASIAGDSLEVTTSDGRTYRPRTLLVHDGIATDPSFALQWQTEMPIEFAGDGRAVMGADAMPDEGRSAAFRLARRLDISTPASPSDQQAQRFQAFLRRLFEHELATPSPQTMLCRCEQQRFGDVAALGGVSSREVRLSGRIGMGNCQGRFCWRHVAAAGAPVQDPFRVEVPRWPLRPVALSALAKTIKYDDRSQE